MSPFFDRLWFLESEVDEEDLFVENRLLSEFDLLELLLRLRLPRLKFEPNDLVCEKPEERPRDELDDF